MPGHILKGTQIAVDLWKTEALNAGRVKFFFLSHLHADHTEGLSRNWAELIYTSPLNSELLQLKGLVTLNVVKPLQIGQGHIISVNKNETFTVTLLDANHCPGSVMFIFEGNFGNILYTGDFCHTPDILPPKLPVIDILYLDNTYCSEKYQIPAREEATKEVIKRSQECLNNSKLLIIGVDSLGKEDLVAKVAESVESKVYFADKERAEVLNLLGLNHIYDGDPCGAKIHVRRTKEISKRILSATNLIKPTCAILPTSRFLGTNSHVNQNTCPGIHVVPYSCHSSYKELRSFVERVRPKLIIPIISSKEHTLPGGDGSELADMTVFNDLCLIPNNKSDFSDNKKRYRSCLRDDDFCEVIEDSMDETELNCTVSISPAKGNKKRRIVPDTGVRKGFMKTKVTHRISTVSRHDKILKNNKQRGIEFLDESVDMVSEDDQVNMEDMATAYQKRKTTHKSDSSHTGKDRTRKSRTACAVYRITYVDAKNKKTFYIPEGVPSHFDRLFH